MADLIDREAVLKAFSKPFVVIPTRGNCKTITAKIMEEMYGIVHNAPAIDAEPVVRCGECKHLLPNGKCTMFADDNICPSASDFCSAGERRDDNDP